MYVVFLREQERSPATVQKYVHDITALSEYTKGKILTKADVFSFLKKEKRLTITKKQRIIKVINWCKCVKWGIHMFKIAICDDENLVCAEIESIITEYKSQYKDEIETEVFYSGNDLCNQMSMGNYYDLIFLDIEMQILNGVAVGRKIRGDMDNQTTQIVFVSAKDNYYRDLFEIRPQNFISKPIDASKIIAEIKKAQTLTGKLNGLFSFKIGHDTFKIPCKNILWFESIDRKVKLVGINREDVFYGNLDEIEQELLKHQFLRIHRSYLINYFHVTRFKYTEVTMSNNITLPISQLKQKIVRNLQSEWDMKRG